MTDFASVRITVHGRVQGVFFRISTVRCAERLKLTGWVRNLPGGRAVEVEAEGERNRLEKLVDYLKTGPPGARVDRVETVWSEYNGSYTSFDISH
ncbi:acylphosphatase [Chloroflexota bacterium]